MFYYRWMQSVDASPGLNKLLLDTLQRKRVEDPENYTNVCFTLDAMSIKKATQFNKATGKISGFVDLGDGTDENDIATEALVFMIMGLKGHWKAPIGYYITSTLTAETQKVLVEQALRALHERGFIVQCLTMDGHGTNIAMCHLMGCHLKLSHSQGMADLKTSFPHPVTGHDIYVILDACHMVKLARNMFEAYKVLTSMDGRIKWSYISMLHDHQLKEGLHAGNKLTAKHVDFHNQKMKVSLAVQTLSRSVATAIQFLQDCGDNEFKDSSPTVKFLQVRDSFYESGKFQVFSINKQYIIDVIVFISDD